MKTVSTKAQVSKIIRKELKARNISAKVSSSSGMLTDCVYIYTNDLSPATIESLENFVEDYRADSYDALADYHDVKPNPKNLPRVTYIIIQNDLSAETMQRAYEIALEIAPELENYPSIYKEMNGEQWHEINYFMKKVLKNQARIKLFNE